MCRQAACGGVRRGRKFPAWDPSVLGRSSVLGVPMRPRGAAKVLNPNTKNGRPVAASKPCSRDVEHSPGMKRVENRHGVRAPGRQPFKVHAGVDIDDPGNMAVRCRFDSEEVPLPASRPDERHNPSTRVNHHSQTSRPVPLKLPQSGAGPPGRQGHGSIRRRLPGRYQGRNPSDLFGYEVLGRARTCIRSPCCPNRLRNSTGLPSALANQCGVWVSNSAASPGRRSKSLSPSTRRSRPLRM